MREVHLRSVDLNLLVPLELLLDHRSVSKAAALANMSQPAMSRALGRLRTLLRDPLLVKHGGGMIATPTATRLLPAVKRALAEVSGLFATRSFEPATWSQEVAIAASDQQTVQLLPGVMARLAKEAPLLRISVVPMGPQTWLDLRAGQLDLAFGVAQDELPSGLTFGPLYQDKFVSLVRKEHPAVAAWSLEAFLRLEHILVTVVRDGHGFIDALLAAQGLSRRVVLRLPHFYAAMVVAAQTDAVVTLPRSLADTYGERLALKALAPPLTFSPFTIGLIWPDALDHDAGMAWLRRLITDEVGLSMASLAN